MKRTLLPLLSVLLALPQLNARMVVTRQSNSQVQQVSLLDNQDYTNPARARIAVTPAGSASSMMDVKLVNTGVKIADVQSGKVSLAELRAITNGKMRSNTPHPQGSLPANAAVLAETMDGFTVGTQSNPVALTNGLSNVNPQYLQPGTDNLYGYGVYSMGNGMGALMGSGNEFRIGDIQGSGVTTVGFWVGALQSGAAVDMNMIEGLNGTSFLLQSGATTIPYDGNFYWYEASHPGFTDKNKQPISCNVSLMIMGSNGSADTDLAFAGIWVDGTRYAGNSGGGGGTTPTPDPTTTVGVPSGVGHTVAFDKQSFTVNYGAADNATHHELYVFNDVYGPATANYLNVDWSPLNVGASDYQNPNLTYYAQNVALAEIPGGMCHWPVLVNGALGFGYLAAVVESTNSWAGFETADYDLSATGGVASLNFRMYPTDYTVFILNEYAYNKTTGKYDLVDYAELDGGSIQWNSWDDFNVTLDYVNANTYDLEHVYFMFGLVSEGDADTPCFLYFSDMNISVDIPSGKMAYYLHADKEVQGSTSITQKGDVAANKFNYLIRGNYRGNDGTVYGEWATHPQTGTFYVDAQSGVQSLQRLDNDADAEYYDLQGRRVLNPGNGFYIVRHGDKVAKRALIN